MKKEISPDMYNYNKYPGPSFARVGDKIVSENIELDLLDNYKEAFDQTVFGQRFSPLLLKFDYIVGDWGNDQLRLKGFYKDHQNVKSELTISRLDDYLTEYCNFGCAYFVLANSNPQEWSDEVEEKAPRHKRNRSRQRKRHTLQSDNTSMVKEHRSLRNESDKKRSQKTKRPRHFTVYNDKSSSSQSKDILKKEVHQSVREVTSTKKSFIIRQK